MVQGRELRILIAEMCRTSKDGFVGCLPFEFGFQLHCYPIVQ